MKKLYTIIGCLILILTTLAAVVMTSKSGTAMVVCMDKTDSFQDAPDARLILAQTGITNNRWQGVSIRLTTITEYAYNQVYQLTLQDQLFLLGNPTERDTAIRQFTQELATKIKLIQQEKIMRDASDIYTTLVRELNQLAKEHASQKLAIVYSDLKENTPLFSVYDSTGAFVLRQHPEIVQQQLLAMAKPDDLSGIQLYFIHTVSSSKDNAQFVAMSEVLTNIFTASGATVFVAANLTQTPTL